MYVKLRSFNLLPDGTTKLTINNAKYFSVASLQVVYINVTVKARQLKYYLFTYFTGFTNSKTKHVLSDDLQMCLLIPLLL